MGAPVRLLPPCRMASSRKENNACKNKRPEAGCGVKGAGTPSRQSPARSARGAAVSARRRRADSEQPARKRRYLPPAPARQPVLRRAAPAGDGCGTRALEALIFLVLLLFPAHPPAVPEEGGGGAGLPRDTECDGRARRPLAGPEQPVPQPTMEGQLHLPAWGHCTACILAEGPCYPQHCHLAGGGGGMVSQLHPGHQCPAAAACPS